MKRRITRLEQKLLDNGYELVLKRYWGKKSEKTLCYEYHKYNDLTFPYIIVLDKKRERVVKYGIGEVDVRFLEQDNLKELHTRFFELKEFVESGFPEEEIPQELLESVE